MKKIILLMVLSFPFVVFAQNSCGAMQAAKEKTYGFRPSQIDDKGRKAKSDEMDAFWKLAGEQKKAGIDCMSALLQAEQKDGFFLFDGAALLHSLDSSGESTKIVLESLQRADLNEIDMAGFLRLAMSLAQANADIGPLAGRYLKREKITAFVPQHSMTVDRDTGALFLYGSMSPELADGALVEALRFEEPYARSTGARILAVHMTKESYRALSELQKVSELSELSRKEIETSRTYYPYKAPARGSKFTRQEVLEYIRLIPHTRQESEAARVREEAYEKKNPNSSSPKKGTSDSYLQYVAESPPFEYLSGHDRFVESAIATLTEADLPIVREARRKSIHGLSDESIYEFFAYTTIIRGIVNRLDLYKEYRIH